MRKTYQQAEQVIDQSQSYEATLETDKGSIVIALSPKEAPKSVNNFVFLAREGFYDGLTFHRVVDDFVVQAGCPEGTGSGGPGYRFEDEPVVGDYVAGAVAMANAGPNTNGSQFFICTVDDRRKLDRLYNLFGQVTDGMEVVTGIRQGDVIQKVTVREAPAAAGS
ncbi:MAG TPA: peptidylprolyl isomerase [Candidatus Dormibacteraeota bacterium]|jgi:cyclophilin family peptidyl-prolyl cis-trans isomerase|nr:peptidylprolyl isomerase [Candidatus Dormibacteraeota bacterium]